MVNIAAPDLQTVKASAKPTVALGCSSSGVSTLMQTQNDAKLSSVCTTGHAPVICGLQSHAN